MEGVHIAHTITAGLRGPGRVLDPLLRLYFSRGFARAMDEHVRAEFPKLRDVLYAAGPAGRATTSTFPSGSA